MKVIEKQLSELIPYENNPRNNDEAVRYVAKMGDKHQRIHHAVDWERCVPKILSDRWKK